jgi:membrane protein YqaA with SNARE-associated domain
MPFEVLTPPVLYVACFGICVVSGLFPWVSAEALLLSYVVLGPAEGSLLVVAVAAAAGQMTGKSLIYAFGRGAERIRSPRLHAWIERWSDRFRKRPSGALSLVFVSAFAGLPPFYAVSVLSGVLRVSFVGFVVFGVAGRLLRFGTIITVPGLVLSA